MNRIKIYVFSLCFVSFLLTDVYADPEKQEMDIKREKDRTVYIIGGQENTIEKDRSEEDRRNSWDMLKNMNIRIDKR